MSAESTGLATDAKAELKESLQEAAQTLSKEYPGNLLTGVFARWHIRISSFLFLILKSRHNPKIWLLNTIKVITNGFYGN